MEHIRAVLSWFVFGPGAGYLTYKLINAPRIEEAIGKVYQWMGNWGVGKRETKRIISFVLSWALSSIGYGLMFAVGMTETDDALNTIISLSGISTITSQLAHGRELDKE